MYMNPMMGPRLFGRRGRGPGLGLILLAAQIHRFGVENIPGVTLSLMGANIGMYFWARNVWSGCLGFAAVVYGGQWWRMLSSAFLHGNDWHLLYNMTSLMWKGYNLERAMGGAKFLALVAILLVLTPVIHLALIYASLHLDGDTIGFSNECSIGFSGILFGLKVMTTLNSNRMHDVFFGLLSVEAKYVVWAELLLIHFIYPGTSFLGHVSGILAGLLYGHGYIDPLVFFVESCTGPLVAAVTNAHQQFDEASRNFNNNNNNPNYGFHGRDDRDEPPPQGPTGGHRDEAARRAAAEAARQRWNAAH